MQNNNTWKVVKQNKNNDDQYLIGFFNTQEMAYDNIPYLMRKYGNWIKDKDDLIVKMVDTEMILNPVATDYSHYCRSLMTKEEYEMFILLKGKSRMEQDEILGNLEKR